MKFVLKSKNVEQYLFEIAKINNRKNKHSLSGLNVNILKLQSFFL